MSKYYFLAEKIKQNTAFAYTEFKTPASPELDIIPILRLSPELPFILVLKKVTISKSGLEISSDLSNLKYLWLDYQPNNLTWPLMSEKMKNIISSHLTGKEDIVWIKAIIHGGGEIKNYFIPRFQKKLDVIDEQKTLFVTGTSHIIKPVFSLSKIIHYNLFHKSQEFFWEITSGLYVSELLKKTIQKEKLTGIDFEEISISQ